MFPLKGRIFFWSRISGGWSQSKWSNCTLLKGEAQYPDPNLGAHYWICDKTSKCAVIGYLNKKMVVYRESNLSIPVLTSRALSKRVAIKSWTLKTMMSNFKKNA